MRLDCVTLPHKNHVYLKRSVKVIGTPHLELTHKLIDICIYILGKYWNPCHYYGNQNKKPPKRSKNAKKKNSGNYIYFTNTPLY